MSWGVEAGKLPGHEKLTMADQMRAKAISPGPKTSSITGAIENPRREYLKQRIAQRTGASSLKDVD